jgi:hypothetical protein
MTNEYSGHKHREKFSAAWVHKVIHQAGGQAARRAGASPGSGMIIAKAPWRKEKAMPGIKEFAAAESPRMFK